MILSSSGGVWVVGQGLCIRVIEQLEQPGSWKVMEELTRWQGLPPAGIEDLIEEPDGALWLATGSGVVYMSSNARRAHPHPPRIMQTGAVFNGRLQEAGGKFRLAYENNQIELHFAALSYRSPEMLRYQYRLKADDPWIESQSDVPVFRFFALRPGRYAAEVRASLDGANWSEPPARIDFEVLRPWYLHWWAITGMGLVVAAVLFSIHRYRVSFLMRLERQRSLIAMDLHDEIGSGLGSIGILSGVASSDNVNDQQRRELTRTIVDTAAELGNSLTDIVWSLRPDSATLEVLASRVRFRASRLFPDGGPAFKTDFPETWPAVQLSLAVRHNILLIASEALYNAARHANAKAVTLGIAPEGRNWRLWVADDGGGLDSDSIGKSASGLGLVSMRRRADAIGADIGWSSNSGAGTRVTVLFSLQAVERRATWPQL